MAEFKIGSLRFTWKGVWATSTFYNRDAVVSFNGKTYVCLVPHTSSLFYSDIAHVTPQGESTPYWIIMFEGKTWKTEWAPSTEYSEGNIITYGGSVYFCSIPHTSGITFDILKWATAAQFINWTTDWLPLTLYYKFDIVKYGGRAYVCNVEHTSSDIVTGLEADILNWDLLNDGIEYKGTWNQNSVRYKAKDIVKNGPDLWIANQSHTSSVTFDLAKWDVWIPGLDFSASWNSTESYQSGDVVIYGGYSYTSITTNNTNNIPSTNSANWTLLTIGYSLQNEWNSSNTYKIGSVVRSAGQLYEAIQDNANQSPSLHTITTTYTSAGSSGTILIVADSTGITSGMSVTCPASSPGVFGISRGQIVSQVLDQTTVKLSEPPDGILNDADELYFTGVNSTFWTLLTPGVTWKNRWQSGSFYNVGDIVVWKNTSFKCVVSHNSQVNPTDDFVHWATFLQHDRFNVLNNPGEIIVKGNVNNESLSIGPQGFLIKSNAGVPIWSDVFVTPNVFYVAPNGTDSAAAGTNWDRPWQTIKFACDQVSKGTLFQNAAYLLLENKEFIIVELYQWMLYNKNYDISPFNGTNYDWDSEGKAQRDAEYIVDAIVYDMTRGGNSQSVAATLEYFSKGNKNSFVNEYVASRIDIFLASVIRLQYLINIVLNTSTVDVNYQSLANIQPAKIQVTNRVAEQDADLTANNLISIIINALTVQSSEKVPPENSGITVTIMIKTGTYKEQIPIVVPENTALAGDELRGVVVQPFNVINSLVTSSSAASNLFTVGTTTGMSGGTPVQFVSINPVSGKNTVFGNVDQGITYYVVGSSITANTFSVSSSPGGPIVNLLTFSSAMYVYGGDALLDMFRVRNGSGIRNMTLTGLLGTLSSLNSNLTRRPTGGSFVCLDPGKGTNDTSAWIFRKSPYIQNVTNFGIGCTGLKIDGSLHDGGNKSVVCNDFTQILSDGIGIWTTGYNALCEAVSVFSYYNYAGYFAESGGKIRATNGNSSYGTYGVVAEGYDLSEVPISGAVFNQYYQATASPLSALGLTAGILKLQFTHAGESYNTASVTNILKFSNIFTSWSTDGNVALVQSISSPFNAADAWIAIGNTSGTDSSFISQSIQIPASGSTYTSVAGINLNGSGTNATFNVTVNSTSYAATVNAAGSGYVVGNQISIPGSSLGGGIGANDLTITIESLSGSAISTITSAGTVPIGSQQPFTFSLYCKQGTAISLDAVLIFSGNLTTTCRLNFDFNSKIALGTSPDTGILPTPFAVVSLPNGWYQISANFYDSNALNTSLTCKIYPRGVTGNAGYSYIYGAQLEFGNYKNFYQSTEDNRYSTFANIDIFGAGINAKLVGDELRFGGVFEPRVITTNNLTGGAGYLLNLNNAQSGTSYSLTIAASDINTASNYEGMRLFINSGTGAGQYGLITHFNATSKIATVIKDSFTFVSIDSIMTNALILSSASDINSLYVGQPVQFVPTTFTSTVTSISQASVNVGTVLGGTINTMTVTSTVLLLVGMKINFIGTAGGVAEGYDYYILNILDLNNIQISQTLGGAVLFLNNETLPELVLRFPANTSYLTVTSTSNMAVNLPIKFTGISFGEIDTGSTYYINDIYDSTSLTISSSLVSVTVTATTGATGILTVDSSLDLNPLHPIRFSSISGFNSSYGSSTFYINKKPSSTQITLASGITTATAISTSLNSKMIVLSSTSNMVVGNPIRFTGTVFGGIINNTVYYISYINDSQRISVSASSAPIFTTATATTVTSNLITVSSTANFTLLYPIVFSGITFGGITANTTYYISTVPNSGQFTISASIVSVEVSATAAVSNLITVPTTAGFIANHPIIFGGEVAGGIISTSVYYILAVNDLTSFTISTSIGGSAVILTDTASTFTARTTGIDVSLSTASGASMYVSTMYNSAHISLTNGSGSVIARTTFGDVPVASTVGSMTGTSTSPNTILSAGAGTLTASFNLPLVGGSIVTGTEYFIKTVVLGALNSFTISSLLGGATLGLTTGTGSMQMGESGWDNVNSATPDVSVFDSTTVYSIEPSITFNRPGFSQIESVLSTQAFGTSYVAVAAGHNKFIAIPSQDSTISISTDGVSWAASALPLSASWKDIAFGNHYWVIISSGGTAIPGSKVLFSNSDLATAKTAYLPSIASWKSVSYGNGVFVAIATSSSAAAYSTNFGATWTSATLPFSTSWTSVTYGKGIFVAIASGGTSAAYSINNGVNWIPSSLSSVSAWSSVKFGNGRFVAVSATASTQPCYSFDGITWFQSPYAISADTIAYGNGVFVALNSIGSTTGYTSENGKAWSQQLVSINPVTSLGFGFSNNGVASFISTSNSFNGSRISAGTAAKGRIVVSLDNSISSIKLWEPGANYVSSPIISILDPNATVSATIFPRLGNGVLGNPSFINSGSGYSTSSTIITIRGSGYADDFQRSSTLVCKSLSSLPSPGDSLAIFGNSKTYKVTSTQLLEGTVAPNIKAIISLSPSLTSSTAPTHLTAVTIRTKYSQARLTNHDFLNIGYGNQQESNYPKLPSETELTPSNEIVESQNGRVFYSATDQDGNFRVGNLFAVEQATGIVTLSASQFGLNGLNQLKLGGILIGGREVVITQFSTDQTFAANSNSIIPTQKAIKSYLTARLSQGGSNTFTGQLIAGTTSIGGPDKLGSTIQEDNVGSHIKIPVKVNVHGSANGLIDGDAMALSYFMQSLNR